MAIRAAQTCGSIWAERRVRLSIASVVTAGMLLAVLWAGASLVLADPLPPLGAPPVGLSETLCKRCGLMAAG
jgi:hypothetical protein